MQNIDLCLMKFGRHQKLRFEIESQKKKKRNSLRNNEKKIKTTYRLEQVYQ